MFLRGQRDNKKCGKNRRFSVLYDKYLMTTLSGLFMKEEQEEKTSLPESTKSSRISRKNNTSINSSKSFTRDNKNSNNSFQLKFFISAKTPTLNEEKLESSPLEKFTPSLKKKHSRGSRSHSESKSL